jgi:hypothetical protein
MSGGCQCRHGDHIWSVTVAIVRASERYREAMEKLSSGPAQRLITLLETLPPRERQEITAWLLDRKPRDDLSRMWLEVPSTPRQPAQRLTSVLASGEDTQLITIRLPADRHAELRQWCTDHGFTMAAVVRGLVDRFIEEHQDLPHE